MCIWKLPIPLSLSAPPSTVSKTRGKGWHHCPSECRLIPVITEWSPGFVVPATTSVETSWRWAGRKSQQWRKWWFGQLSPLPRSKGPVRSLHWLWFAVSITENKTYATVLPLIFPSSFFFLFFWRGGGGGGGGRIMEKFSCSKAACQ